MPNKGKEETKKLQNKLKQYPILHIKVKEESIGLLRYIITKMITQLHVLTRFTRKVSASFSKFINFCWIAKYVVLVIGKIVTIVWQCRFPKAQAQRTIRHSNNIVITDENLDLTNFANIFDFINTSVFTYEHALNKFPT